MRLFCMDLHISVIEDFKTACPDVEVVDWCLSGHAWVMKRHQESPDHINPRTWRDLTPERMQAFRERYDSFLKTFDGFIVGFCSAFAMIYEPYGKPILMLNAVRYDIPFCWTRNMAMRLQWNACLERLNREGRLTIVSNNHADALYTTLGCGLTPQVLPSLCLYTKTTYAPTKPTFLCASGPFAHPLLTPKRDLPPRHAWSDVTSYRGVVHLPYEVSLMSLFEQFTAGCPLFFPSKAYWTAHPDIQSLSAYWADALPAEFQELSTLDAWIERADPYTTFASPNTHYYDSEEHLYALLESFVYVDDRAMRQAHIERVKTEWARILQRMLSGQFWTKAPRHICYNRLPLLANVVFDVNYGGSGVTPQHTYPTRTPLSRGDVVFVKTEYLDWVFQRNALKAPITLVTGVSDVSPSPELCARICANPMIRRWIGCNIPVSHPKIRKLPIGVGEPERPNGDHETLVRLHAERVPWEEKQADVCVPFHSKTHGGRTQVPTLPQLPFEDYMRAISQHQFVVCQAGNGLDTHRVCEVLLMGSIPVIQSSGLDDMYAQWNCLLVPSLDTIDTTGVTWDPAKDEAFLDVFWLRDALKDQLL